MSSHPCSCDNGIYHAPYGMDVTCQFCGGSGWIWDGMEYKMQPSLTPEEIYPDETE